MKNYFTTAALFLILVANSSVFGQVPIMDPHALPKEAKNIQQATKDLSGEISKMKSAILSLTDVGSFLDQLLSIDFLFPKSKKPASDITKPFNESKNSNPTAQFLPTGDDGKAEKFPNRAAVAKVVDEKFNTSKAGGSSSDALDMIKDVAVSATGLGGVKGMDIQKKRVQLPETKQAFGRYTLAVSLVHRTLAYRTLSDAKKDVQNDLNEATDIRKTHSTKTNATGTMAETYNRLLLTQASGNALLALKAMDQEEGRMSLGLEALDISSGVLNEVRGKLGL